MKPEVEAGLDAYRNDGRQSRAPSASSQPRATKATSGSPSEEPKGTLADGAVARDTPRTARQEARTKPAGGENATTRVEGEAEQVCRNMTMARGEDLAGEPHAAADARRSASNLADKASETVRLSRAQARNIRTIDNVLRDHAKPHDFSGVASELAGKPIPKPGGGYWDHKHEMENSVTALEKAIRGLRGSLKNPNLSPTVRAHIEASIERASSVLERMKRTLGRQR